MRTDGDDATRWFWFQLQPVLRLKLKLKLKLGLAKLAIGTKYNRGVSTLVSTMAAKYKFIGKLPIALMAI